MIHEFLLRWPWVVEQITSKRSSGCVPAASVAMTCSLTDPGWGTGRGLGDEEGAREPGPLDPMLKGPKLSIFP